MKKLLLLLACSPQLLSAQKNFTDPQHILPGHTNDVDVVAVSSQGYVATGAADKLINIYADDSGYVFNRTLPGHLAPVTALEFSRDGKLLASGSSDNTVRIWDSVFTNVKVLDGHKANINALMFDYTRKYLFSGSDDKTINVWNVASGKLMKTISHGQAVNGIKQSPTDPKMVYVAAFEPRIKTYNMMTNSVVSFLDGHTDIVNSIDISRDGKILISGSNDKSARIWDLTTRKEIRKLTVDCWKVTAVAFTDDARYAATGCNDGSVKVWEVATGKLVASMDGAGNYVRDLAFSKYSNDLFVAYMIRTESGQGLRVWPTTLDAPPKRGPGADIPEPQKQDTRPKIAIPSNAAPKKK